MRHLKLFESFDNGFDLEKEFDYLNKALFGGELKRIPLKWSNTKTRSGALLASAIKQGGRIIKEEPQHIELSKFFSKTREQLLGILAHEMIHLWILQNGIKDDSHHGTVFMSKLRELNKMNVVDIPRKDSAIDDVPSDNRSLSKPVVVFYQHDRTRDMKMIALIDQSTFSEEAVKRIIDTMEYTSEIGKRDFTVKFFTSDNWILRKFPKTTKFKNAHGLKYVTAPDSIDELIASGKKLDFYDITAGKATKMADN